MFDDLHDPQPPVPDMATLAEVSARAKHLRRRRAAITGSIAVGVLAVAGVTVGVANRDDDPGSIAIVDRPTDTNQPSPTTGATDPPRTDPPTTDPSTTEPSTTEPAIVSDSTEPLACPAVGLTYIGAGLSAALINDPSFGAVTTTDDMGPIHAERGLDVEEDSATISIGRYFGSAAGASGTVKSGGAVSVPWQDEPIDVLIGVRSDDADRAACIRGSATYDIDLDLLDAQDERMITAIDGAGDAVVLSYNGVPTVLHDGTDPDDPLPEEGDPTYVDGAAVPFLANDAWVGLCCEPVSGSLLHGGADGPLTYDDLVADGSNPVLSPDDRFVATRSYESVLVLDAEVQDLVHIELSATEYRQASALTWVGSDTLAIQTAGDSASDVELYRIGDGQATNLGSVGVPSGESGYEPRYELVGAGALAGVPTESAAVIWLWDRSAAVIMAFPVSSLSSGSELAPEQAIRQVPIEGGLGQVSVVGSEIRWIDADRGLWTAPLTEPRAATQIAGEYIWVR